MQFDFPFSRFLLLAVYFGRSRSWNDKQLFSPDKFNAKPRFRISFGELLYNAGKKCGIGEKQPCRHGGFPSRTLRSGRGPGVSFWEFPPIPKTKQKTPNFTHVRAYFPCVGHSGGCAHASRFKKEPGIFVSWAPTEKNRVPRTAGNSARCKNFLLRRSRKGN